MSLPPFWKTLAWDQWAYGLLTAVLGGGATSASGVLSVMAIDPEKFNFSQPWNLVKASFASFLLGGVIQMWAYLKQGLPPVMTSKTETQQTETAPDGGVVTKKTSSEVVVQPGSK